MEFGTGWDWSICQNHIDFNAQEIAGRRFHIARMKVWLAKEEEELRTRQLQDAAFRKMVSEPFDTKPRNSAAKQMSYRR